MSLAVTSQVWEESRHAGGALLVLLRLAEHADESGRCFPSISLLALKCRMTSRNVSNHLATLVASGEVVRSKAGRHNAYRISLDSKYQKPTSDVDDAEHRKPTSDVEAENRKLTSDVDDTGHRKPTSATPEAHFPSDRKPTSNQPSVNHQEPLKAPLAPLAGSPTASPPPATKRKPAAKCVASKQCPADFFVTVELLDWARANVPSVDINAATATFRDFEFRTAHTNWPATWRNWMRKAVEFNGNRNGTPRMPARTEAERRRDHMDQLTGRSRHEQPDNVIDIGPGRKLDS